MTVTIVNGQANSGRFEPEGLHYHVWVSDGNVIVREHDCESVTYSDSGYLIRAKRFWGFGRMKTNVEIAEEVSRYVDGRKMYTNVEPRVDEQIVALLAQQNLVRKGGVNTTKSSR